MLDAKSALGSKVTTYISSKEIKKEWVLIDVSNEVVGRVAAKIAFILKGKDKPNYTPFLDCGDNVIAVNCDNLIFTGNKYKNKFYIKHTGYPGGQKKIFVSDMMKNNSSDVLLHAVKGMLPKNKLGRKLLKNLRCFNLGEHNLKHIKNIKNIKFS